MFVAGLSGAAAQIWVQAAHRPALGYPHAGQIVMRLPSMSPPVTISFLSPLRELVPAATAVHTTPTLLHRAGGFPCLRRVSDGGRCGYRTAPPTFSGVAVSCQVVVDIVLLPGQAISCSSSFIAASKRRSSVVWSGNSE